MMNPEQQSTAAEFVPAGYGVFGTALHASDPDEEEGLICVNDDAAPDADLICVADDEEKEADLICVEGSE